MDNLSRAVALDQALLANGAKIVSLAPGVIDTDMQVQLRSSSGRRLSRAADLRQAEGSGPARLEPRRRGPPRRLPGPRRFRRQPGGRRSRSLTSPRAGGRSGCATIRRIPATNSARSTRPETPHVTTRARRPRLGRAPLRLRADAAGARRRPSAAAAAAPPAAGSGDWVQPNDKLVIQGIPPIPASVVQDVARYADFRGHGFVDWHPSRREMLVAHRKAGASTTQIYRLTAPMGELEQLTDFAEPVVAGELRAADRRLDRLRAQHRRRRGVADLPPRPRDPAGERRLRAGHAARPGRLAEPEQPADLFVGAAGPHRRRRAARRDRADADPGRSGEPRRAAQARRASGRRLGRRRRVVGRPPPRAQPVPIPPTSPRSGCSTSPAASAPASCRRRAATTRRCTWPSAWKRDNSGFFFVSDRSGEFRELMFYSPRRRPDHADHPPHQGRHRRREPQPRRQAARRAGQGRRPDPPGVLRHRRLQRAAVAGAARGQRHGGALPSAAAGARVRAQQQQGPEPDRHARPRRRRLAGLDPAVRAAGGRHRRLRRAADRPLEELRRPRDHRHRRLSRGALSRQAPGADRHPRRARGRRRVRLPGPQQLLSRGARRRRDPAERARLRRLRQDLPHARRRPEARRLGQGHRRPARLDRRPSRGSTRAGSSSPAAATAAT